MPSEARREPAPDVLDIMTLRAYRAAKVAVDDIANPDAATEWQKDTVFKVVHWMIDNGRE